MKGKWARSLVLLALTLSASGCAMPDRHVPPFARVPYQPLSRQAVVSIAMREWRLFGQAVNDGPGAEPGSAIKPEREPGLWQRVGEYWWLGLNADAPESGWTGKHDGTGRVFPPEDDGEFAWSAAFVSYVLRIAGAGRHFPYSADHADYINAAKRMKGGAAAGWIVVAERPERYAPQPGDLICFGRGRASGLRYDDLPTAALFPSHCDIVVDASMPGSVAAIGGNVRDSVAMTYVPVTERGMLAAPDGTVLDTRYPWMAVLRLVTGGAGV